VNTPTPEPHHFERPLEIKAQLGHEVWDLGSIRLPATANAELLAGWEMAVADGLRAIARELTEQTVDDATGRPRTELGHRFGCACPGCEP
jgi:hypothetical protein